MGLQRMSQSMVSDSFLENEVFLDLDGFDVDLVTVGQSVASGSKESTVLNVVDCNFLDACASNFVEA